MQIFAKILKNLIFIMNPNQLLSRNQIFFLFVGFVLVYLVGLFIPLMENDSAQHATMAMRMANSGNFLEIYKGDNPYLDKPHLHFWLAALSMKIFGINHIAYRIPAILCLFLAAFSVKKIADLLYKNENLSYTASLIFLASQTIILSAHDVRTDAVLTGFIALSVWQFLAFIKTQKIVNVILAGFFTALAFSSKGLMAIVIIGFSVFSYLLYSREWLKFFNLKIIFAALSFGVGILPILYAYYHQFGNEGVEFILFNQSVNRLQAKGFEQNSPDYSFFFHTLLWAFLPFSIAFYTGVFERTRNLIKERFQKVEGVEFLTLGGFWLVMLVFSFSKFKLPHYLNGLIPILSVFTASYIFEIFEKNQWKKARVFWVIQLVVISVSLVGVLLLTYYFTGIHEVVLFVVGLFFVGTLLLYIFKKENMVRRWVLVSLLFAITINIFLNSQFYPVLTQYQGGLKMAQYFEKNQLSTQNLFMPKDYEIWSFDFYTQQNTPRKEVSLLKKGDRVLVYENDLQNITQPYKILHQETHFKITKLSLKFLNPKTRNEKLKKLYLLEILN